MNFLLVRQQVPETSPQVDLGALENQSDGLIFFDSSGDFTGCSAKMEKLAGSAAAVREALDGASWPADFASGGECDSLSGHALTLTVRRPRPVDIRCVRTGEGFVAAVTIEQGSDARSHDYLLEIFSSLILERRAISRHLHSSLTQDLVALSLSLSALREDGPGGVLQRDDRKLSEAIARLDRCCQGVRTLSYVLAPPSFLNAGLIETVNWYASVLRADAGIDFTLHAPALAADPSSEINELFFAALQHMAAAAIWQPQGARISVTISHERAMLSMRVDCAPHTGEPVPESPLIRERANAIGGSVRFVAGDGESSLEISVPWAAPLTAAK